MNLSFYWVDAFTDRVFRGNPAGVIPLPQWLPAEQMQSIAFENGLAETAFFVRKGEARFELRWFTPEVEIDLCGHATLASAHVLFTQLGEKAGELHFETKSGELVVKRLEDDRLELDFPSRPPLAVPPTGDFTAALGKRPLEILKNTNNWFCVFSSQQEIESLRPDFAAVKQIAPGRIIVTAPGQDCDFVSRFFAPGVGIDEDPVTGSAHCALIPFWAGRLGRDELKARQVSRRGGELWCRHAGDRVQMAGRAALYMTGEIHL